MGDQVTCTAALQKNEGRPDLLVLAVAPDWKLRIINCRPQGEPQRGERPEWEYLEQDGRLCLRPSLLCTDTQFHTDYDWSCAYILVENETIAKFYAANPDLQE